jgi:RecB family exonuclease
VRFDAARLAESGFAPSAFERDFGPLAVTAADGTEVRLLGRIDRVDAAAGDRAIVIDYKYSKRGFDRSRERELAEGAHFQLPVYLLGARDGLSLDARSAWLLPVREPAASGLDLEPEERDALLAETVDRVAAMEADARAGRIVAAPRDRNRCAWCDFADLCRFESWMTPEEGPGANEE